MEEKYFIKTIADEIVEPTINTVIDFEEIALDSLIEGGILEEIPVVKTGLAFYKIGVSIKNHQAIKKIIVFLQNFHKGKIKDEDFKIFKDRFKEDKKYRSKVLETVLFSNERFDEVKKSKIFANLFIAYINRQMSWDDLKNCLFALERVNLNGLNSLYRFLYQDRLSQSEDLNQQPSMSLAEFSLLAPSGCVVQLASGFTITKVGKDLLVFGLDLFNINETAVIFPWYTEGYESFLGELINENFKVLIENKKSFITVPFDKIKLFSSLMQKK